MKDREAAPTRPTRVPPEAPELRPDGVPPWLGRVAPGPLSADQRAMARALTLAMRPGGRTSPNPMVGALAVAPDGRVLAESGHRAAGESHAERLLLESAAARRANLTGATLVCTLEPCAHRGRTAACAPDIASAGFARAVIATLDPNPLVNGAGVALLRAAGIRVVTGVLEEEARRLNEGFLGWIATGLPFVHLKLAVLSDGTVHRGPALPPRISGPESRCLVHLWRHLSAAVLVGSGTLRRDDPALTVRELPHGIEVLPWQPRRVVLASRFELNPASRALRRVAGGPPPLVIGSAEAPGGAEDRLRSAGVETARIAAAGGAVDPAAALGLLGELGLASVLVEGGPRIADALLDAGLVDRLSLFVAGGREVGGAGALRWARLAGRPLEAFDLREARVLRVGEDRLLTGLVRPSDRPQRAVPSGGSSEPQP